MDGIRGPIFIRLGNRGYINQKMEPNSTAGSLKDISISNVVAYGASHASSITGIPGHCVENVSLTDITIHTKGGGTKEMAAKTPEEAIKGYPSSIMWGQPHISGLFVRHVKGLDISNLKIWMDAPDERPLADMDDVEGLYIDRMVTDENSRGTAVITMKDLRNAKLEDLNFSELSEKWLSFSGTKNSEIVVESGLKHISQKVLLSPEVNPENVTLKGIR
jgi:hypothetical protein